MCTSEDFEADFPTKQKMKKKKKKKKMRKKMKKKRGCLDFLNLPFPSKLRLRL